MSLPIPGGWREVELRDLLSESDERVGDRSDLPLLSITKYDGAVLAKDRFSRVLASKDLSRYRVAPRDSVVIDPMLLWDGVIALQHRFAEGVVSPDYRVFRFNSDTDPAFFDFLAHASPMRRQYARAARGTNVRRRRISRDDFLAIRVVVPSTREQREIAAAIKAVDAAIASGEAVVEQLERARCELAEDLLRHGLSSTARTMRATSIGPVPSDWGVATADDLCERIVVGIVIKPTQYYVPEGVPALRSKNVRESRLDLRDLVHISPEANTALSKSQIRAGDVLTVRTGAPGASCVVPPELHGANCIDIIVSTPKPHLRGAFLAEFVNSSRGKAVVAVGQRGLAQQHFNIGEMKRLLVPVPPLAEQDAIVDALGTVTERLTAERAVVAERRGVRDALADALLSGRLRVRDAA